MVVIVLAAIVGAGVWFGQRDRASQTPCERYAVELVRALDHCHSGLTRNHAHHAAACEESIDPSRACLERVKALECEALELGAVASAGDVCTRRR